VTIGVWVYFWVLYSVPLVCMSVLVLVPHCLDYHGFVILPEEWESYAYYLFFFPLRLLWQFWVHINFFFFFGLFAFPRAAPAAYGGFQARGLIGAVAASLRQSHSNAGSEPRLQPTPQLTATPDP